MLFKGFQLVEIAQIRGAIPGAKIVTYTVTQRYIEPSHRVGRLDGYWVSWSDEVDVKKVGNHRVSVPEEQFKNYRIGSPIEIVYPLSGDPYVRDGYYGSDYGTDIFLFIVGLIGTVVMAIAFVLPEKE